MKHLDDVLRALSARRDSTLELLSRLVRVNSHTGNVEGANRVAEMIAESLAHTSLRVTQVPGKHYGDHYAFSTERADHEPAVLLVGHHDTVFPTGSFEGYTVTGDVAHGPGVLDMKGGLSVIVTALCALWEAGILDALPLRFVTVSDEEVGSPTSRAFLEQLAEHAACALVFEAGRAGDAIITSRRGSGHAEITAHGRAAHAGNALSEGRSAIWALSKCIDSLQQGNGKIQGASLSVGLVHGGTARNTVPERAHCEIDLRFSDAEGQHALIAALYDAAAQAAHAVDGTKLDVHVEVSRRPWARTDASFDLYARYAKAARLAGLDASESKTVGGGSDANTVGALGLPTIDGLGPRGSGFHTRSEQIEVSSLSMKAEALVRFLLSRSSDC